jgi:arginase
MKPVFIFAPYWLGNFSPSHASYSRHNWRILAVPPGEGTPTQKMGALDKALADETAAIRAAGKLPVAVVGDCTMSIGMLAGLQRHHPDLTLVWFDSHGDFNTPATSPSGFIGGMPLAMLCGRGEQTIVQGAGAAIQPETAVILTDARDLDPGEAEAVAQSGLTHLPDLADLLTHPLPALPKPIYIHFDVDVLRLADLSAVNYPAQGGPSLETVRQALACLTRTGRVVGVSLTMWNPELDPDGRGEETVMALIDHLQDLLLDAPGR